MAQVAYESTALAGTGKQGKLKCGQDGYYRDVVIGAIGIHNNAGQFYDLASAKKFFDQQSDLMNRIKGGHVRGEYGHPKRHPGMSDSQWLSRVLSVEETQISHHIREVRLVEGAVKDPKTGKPAVGILAELKPCGPYGEALAASMENEHENVCFSIRSLTNDQVTPARWIKQMRRIVTWDFVFLPGIEGANKYNSPSLEQVNLESLAGNYFTEQTIRQVAEEVESGMVSNEHFAVDVRSLRDELYPKSFKASPASLNW